MTPTEVLECTLFDYGIKNFTARELSPKVEVQEYLHLNIIPTITVLQNIRNAINEPLKILYAHGNPAFDRLQSCRSLSLHVMFNAIDFAPLNPTRDKLLTIYEMLCTGEYSQLLSWKGKMISLTPEIMGIGLYNNYLHIDTRGLLNLPAPMRY